MVAAVPPRAVAVSLPMSGMHLGSRRTPEERDAFDDGASQLARLGIPGSREERSEFVGATMVHNGRLGILGMREERPAFGGEDDARLARSRARARRNRRWGLQESAGSPEVYDDFSRYERYPQTTISRAESREDASRCSCCQLENILSEDELARYHRSMTSTAQDGLIPCLPCRTGAHAYVRRRFPFAVEAGNRVVAGLAHREGHGRLDRSGNYPEIAEP